MSRAPLGHGHVVHAVCAGWPVGQAVLAHVEPVALAAQQILGRHDQVLDLDLGVAAAQDVAESGPSLAAMVGGSSRTMRYPGLGSSTMKVENCLCRGASGSVRAITRAMSATLAALENHFSPFRT